MTDSAVEARIDFAGDVRRLSSEDQLLFGRGKGADLDIDDNPLLHRRFGRIWYADNSWWLRNEGTRLPLNVHDRASTSTFTLAPGAEVSIRFSEAVVAFAVGESNYEILLDLRNEATSSTAPGDPSDAAHAVDPATAEPSQVPVAGGQRLLLVAMAEEKLRNPHTAIAIPTNKRVARRLGWTTTQFNRKLDRLCQKFAASGVQGLVGDLADHASDRRRVLVEHTVKHGVITTADLSLLEDYPEPAT